jgi:hypothetical protein
LPRDVSKSWQALESLGFLSRKQARKASPFGILKKQNLMASERQAACSSAVASGLGAAA